MSSSLERMWCENAMLLFVKSDAWSLISSTDLCRVARLPLKAWNNSSQLAITIHNQFKCNHTSKERWSTHKLYSNYFSIFWPLPPLTWIPVTLHQKRKCIKFEFPKKIPIGHELISKMLPENPKIKKIYRGNLLSVYIYTKNLFFTSYNIFSRNLKSSLHLIPITWKLC